MNINSILGGNKPCARLLFWTRITCTCATLFLDNISFAQTDPFLEFANALQAADGDNSPQTFAQLESITNSFIETESGSIQQVAFGDLFDRSDPISLSAPTMLASFPSMIPRDRVGLLFAASEDQAWGSLVVEKTLFEGRLSIDVLVPAFNDIGLGNISTSVKGLLYEDERWLLSAGLGVRFPTMAAPLNITNDVTSLFPFVGAIWTPDSRWVFQSSAQVSFPIGQDTVTYDVRRNGRWRSERHHVNESPKFFLDASASYWLWRTDSTAAISPFAITGVAPTLQLHFSQELGATEINGYREKTGSTADVFAGCHLELGEDTLLSAGYQFTEDVTIGASVLSLEYRYGNSARRRPSFFSL